MALQGGLGPGERGKCQISATKRQIDQPAKRGSYSSYLPEDPGGFSALGQAGGFRQTSLGVACCILDVGLALCSRGVEIISHLKQKPPIS